MDSHSNHSETGSVQPQNKTEVYCDNGIDECKLPISLYLRGSVSPPITIQGEDRIYIGATSALYPVAFGNYDEIEFDVSDAGIAKAYVNDVEVLSVDISSSWIDAPVTMRVARAAGVKPSFDMQYLQISGTRVYPRNPSTEEQCLRHITMGHRRLSGLRLLMTASGIGAESIPPMVALK